MDNKDYIRVLLYSYYTTITGRGVLLKHDYHAVAKRHAETRLLVQSRQHGKFEKPKKPRWNAVVVVWVAVKELSLSYHNGYIHIVKKSVSSIWKLK